MRHKLRGYGSWKQESRSGFATWMVAVHIQAKKGVFVAFIMQIYWVSTLTLTSNLWIYKYCWRTVCSVLVASEIQRNKYRAWAYLRVLYIRESSEEHYLQILYLDLRTIFRHRLFKCSGQGTLAGTSVYPAVTLTNPMRRSCFLSIETFFNLPHVSSHLAKRKTENFLFLNSSPIVISLLVKYFLKAMIEKSMQMISSHIIPLPQSK